MKPGDKPECCKEAREAIQWDEDDGWVIASISMPVWYCPFCGHELGDPDRWADGKAAIVRFKSALPAVMQVKMGPASELQIIAEAFYVAFIDPIERRLKASNG